METTVEPRVWTEIAGGVVVRYDGDTAQTVTTDAAGAVFLPSASPQEEAGAVLWSVIPGQVPCGRVGQEWPDGGPSGFRLVEGRWAPA